MIKVRDRHENESGGTISPKSTTFSPRMRNSPHHFSANVLPAYIRSTVSSRTRFAKPRGDVLTFKNFTVHVLQANNAYQTGHRSAVRHEASDHLAGRRASFLTKQKRKRCAGRRNLTEHSVGGGLGANVLSTQSTREPDVVNGMRESMGRDSRLGVCRRASLQLSGTSV